VHLRWLLWLPAFRLGRDSLTVGTPFSWPFYETNCALDYDFALCFAVLLSSRYEKVELWVDIRGSSFDGPS